MNIKFKKVEMCNISHFISHLYNNTLFLFPFCVLFLSYTKHKLFHYIQIFTFFTIYAKPQIQKVLLYTA